MTVLIKSLLVPVSILFLVMLYFFPIQAMGALVIVLLILLIFLKAYDHTAKSYDPKKGKHETSPRITLK